MTIEQTGIRAEDFTDNALDDFGVVVSYEAVTKTTDNITGDEDLGYAGAVNKTVLFFKQTQDWEQSIEGLIEKGDAYIMSRISDALSKNDRVTYDNKTYLVISVYTPKPGGVELFDYCSLKRIG